MKSAGNELRMKVLCSEGCDIFFHYPACWHASSGPTRRTILSSASRHAYMTIPYTSFKDCSWLMDHNVSCKNSSCRGGGSGANISKHVCTCMAGCMVPTNLRCGQLWLAARMWQGKETKATPLSAELHGLAGSCMW